MNAVEEISNLERRLARFDQKIGQLEAEIDKGNQKLKEDLRPRLEVIRQRRRYAEERLRGARLEQAESWMDEDVRAGILAVFDDIGRRIDSLFGRIS